MRNVYRVIFFKNATPKTAFVVAESGVEATDFLGVRDGTASATEVTRDVEVVGIDPAHAALAPMPITTAPFSIPKRY